MVTETILKQLGGNRFLAMTGAKNLVNHDGRGLSFKLPRFSCTDVNYVKITLNHLDLYDVEFGRIRGFGYEVLAENEGVYADMLQKVFSERTGLRTSL